MTADEVKSMIEENNYSKQEEWFFEEGSKLKDSEYDTFINLVEYVKSYQLFPEIVMWTAIAYAQGFTFQESITDALCEWDL